MVTAVVTSDNHLGAYYARLRPDRLEQRRKALRLGFSRVVDAAIESRVDLFLHAGDLFDRPDPRNAERCFVARQVRRLRDAGIPVFAIAGNHDSPRSYAYEGGTPPHEEMEILGAIHLFASRNELTYSSLQVNGTRVCVWGMSTDFNRPADCCPLEPQLPRHERGGDVDLVLLHYGVEGWAQPFAPEPCLIRANLEQLRTDVICVGHLHARNEAWLRSGALLLNAGATEHLRFGEEHLECGFYRLMFRAGRVDAEYVPLTPQPMRTLELDLAAMDFLEPPDEELLAESDEEWGARAMRCLTQQLEQVAHPELLLRARLTGRLTRSRFHFLDLPRLQAVGEQGCFQCQLQTDGLVVADEFADLTVGYGVSFDAGEELQNTARLLAAELEDRPDEQEICRQAGAELAAAYDRLTGGLR